MRCDNCGHERGGGRYCPRCGQSDRDFQRALPMLVWEVVREALEVDSRIVRSLRSLLIEPGRLSLEFSRNRRADYVSPVRMYLFASLVFFFALSLTAEIDIPQDPPAIDGQPAAASESDIARLAELLDEPRRERMREILDRGESSVARLATVELAKAVAGDPPGPVGRYMIGFAIDALHDPADMFDQLLDQLPVAMFVMLPVYALLLAVFYVNRRHYYVEHLVFALHVHTVTFLVFTLMLLLPTSADRGAVDELATAVGNGLLLALVVYQYLALKRYYGGSHGTTLMRFVGLAVAYALLLAPGVVAVVLLALTFG